MPEQTETEGLVPFWDHVYELTRRLKAWLYSFVIATVLFLVLPGDDAFLKMPFQVYHPLITVILLDIRNRLLDRKSTRLNSSHLVISYAVFCLKKKTQP